MRGKIKKHSSLTPPLVGGITWGSFDQACQRNKQFSDDQVKKYMECVPKYKEWLNAYK